VCPRSSARSAESKSARTATTTRRRRSTLGQSGRKASKDRKDHPESREPAAHLVPEATSVLQAPKELAVLKAILDLLDLRGLAGNLVVTVYQAPPVNRVQALYFHQNSSQP